MSFQTYTRPRRAAVRPAVRRPGPVTLAIRGIRPNELPSWEMRQQQIEDEALRDLRRRVAKAVSVGIDFLDETGGDPDLEDGADDEPSLGASMARDGFGTGWRGDDGSDREDESEHDEPSLCGIEVGRGDDHDREAGDDNGIADREGEIEQNRRFIAKGGDVSRVGGRY